MLYEVLATNFAHIVCPDHPRVSTSFSIVPFVLWRNIEKSFRTQSYDNKENRSVWRMPSYCRCCSRSLSRLTVWIPSSLRLFRLSSLSLRMAIAFVIFVSATSYTELSQSATYWNIGLFWQRVIILLLSLLHHYLLSPSTVNTCVWHGQWTRDTWCSKEALTILIVSFRKRIDASSSQIT